LFVIDAYNTNNNGTTISAKRFAEELNKRGHEVRFLAASKPKEGVYGMKEFKIWPFTGLIHKHGFQFAKSNKKVIREAVEWADLIHCYMPFFLEYNTKKIADELGKPSTTAFHIQPQNITSGMGMGNVKFLNELLFKLFRKTTYNKYGHVHTPSQFMADEILKRGYTAKIHPISNGIQSDFKWTKVPKEPQFEDKILILMVGRLAGEKRQDIIINALQYSKYGDKIQLVFAGKGPKYKQYYKLGQKLKNKPIFTYLPKDELIELLGQCDLYVHASDMESEAISCIEAFATGLVPVISDSDLSATKQFALDERSLFRAGDPKDLARAIDYWLDNPEEKAKMEKVYSESAKKYNIDNSITLFEEMLQEAIEDHKKGLK
jgi:glycosyltransferase involved in cell wall biosynthesis